MATFCTIILYIGPLTANIHFAYKLNETKEYNKILVGRKKRQYLYFILFTDNTNILFGYINAKK